LAQAQQKAMKTEKKRWSEVLLQGLILVSATAA
jgi:hypothetical protein